MATLLGEGIPGRIRVINASADPGLIQEQIREHMMTCLFSKTTTNLKSGSQRPKSEVRVDPWISGAVLLIHTA